MLNILDTFLVQGNESLPMVSALLCYVLQATLCSQCFARYGFIIYFTITLLFQDGCYFLHKCYIWRCIRKCLVIFRRIIEILAKDIFSDYIILIIYCIVVVQP